MCRVRVATLPTTVQRETPFHRSFGTELNPYRVGSWHHRISWETGIHASTSTATPNSDVVWLSILRRHKQTKRMGCIQQIVRCLASPFKKKKSPRRLEIGPPMNFRKEEFPIPFIEQYIDDECSTLAPQNSHISVAEKAEANDAAEQQASKREKVKQHVRRMSAKITPPFPGTS
ncbi:hypothetical protein M432DRAFT_210018 [Thermoascus aurantiacus ATCC 26904]